MKSKLQFNVDDLDKYTVEELKQQVDQAIGQVFRKIEKILFRDLILNYNVLACKSIEDERTIGSAA